MPSFKAKYMLMPGPTHVYLRFFVLSRPNGTWAALGNLTVRKSEFNDLQHAMSGVAFEEEPREDA